MSTASKLPPLPGGGEWHAVLKSALKEQLLTGRPLVLSGRPLRGVQKSKAGARAYCTLASTAQVLQLLSKRPCHAEFCEVVPTAEDREAFEALGHEALLRCPRFFIDLDHAVTSYAPEHLQTLPDILAASHAVLKRLFPDAPPVSLQPVIAENHRKKPNGSFKFSWHVIYPYVSVPTLEVEGCWLAQQMIAEYVAGRDTDEHCIDLAVYTRHRNLRLVGSPKEAKGPPLRVQGVPLEEALPLTLLTHYDPVVAPAEGKRVVPRMLQVAPVTLRAAHPGTPGPNAVAPWSVGGVVPRDFGDLAEWCRRIQTFLDSHQASRRLEWQGARVNQMGETSCYIFARVGFLERGKSRLCVFGQRHNGHAGQRWVLRVDKMHNRLEAACFPNSRNLPCSPLPAATNGRASLRFGPVARESGRCVTFRVQRFV